MQKAIFTAAVLLMSTPLAPALANDDDGYNRYSGYGAHSRVHGQLEDAHERVHEEGFDSRGEHRGYHRAQRYLHREYHEDRPSYSYYGWRRW